MSCQGSVKKRHEYTHQEKTAMRWIPIATDRIQFIGTGKVAEVAEYVELSNNERKRSGNQAKDLDSGMPMWVCDVMVFDPEAARAEVVGVKVAALDQPQTTMGQPVNFHNLRALGYVLNGANRVSYTFRADGLDQGHQKAGDKAA
ncbi:MAG: hypothetical protein L0I76_26820 [Pseudonocardia sp.]|nr:hypothetical protein [Pseudonocardia sp.]